ncbi:hypothetical protein [Bosea sp. UC22_33]|uniref:hypothetical protein n=1 Tax=Bosea sp. UC22_33 TaxID=3350165 RepID=UPI0036717B8E
MGKNFREFRSVAFDQEESCRLMDMRRTGSVEANTGGAPVEAISAKLSNSIDRTRLCRGLHAGQSVGRQSRRSIPKSREPRTGDGTKRGQKKNEKHGRES